MVRNELVRFRNMCRQFSRLAVFMVVCVGMLLALTHLVLPLVFIISGGARPDSTLAGAVFVSPAVFYLAAVWSIGKAMRELSCGRLIKPTMSDALRKVGLALGFGGITSVFLVTNIARLLHGGSGGWLHFDVAGMTLGIIGGALFLLGRVMDRANEVQAELDGMI
jgi:hypothetical protein